MSDTQQPSLVDSFHAACFLLAEKTGMTKQVGVEWSLTKAMFRSWPQVLGDPKDRGGNFIVVSVVLSPDLSWFCTREGEKDVYKPQRLLRPQHLHRFGSAEEGPRFVAQLLWAAANMLDLDDDGEVQAAIERVQRATL